VLTSDQTTEILEVLGITIVEGDDDFSLTHWTCCRNNSLALCGEELEGEFFPSMNEADACVVCLDLMEMDDCPRGYPSCPTEEEDV
jgi:hypothetical protein